MESGNNAGGAHFMLEVSDVQLARDTRTMRDANVRQDQEIDLTLHGLAAVRLVNPSPGDTAAVIKQLGLAQRPCLREPNITIRFVKKLHTPSAVRYLDANDVGFTDDTFLILPGKYGNQARAQIAFDQIGRPCGIICETGIPEVPFLVPIFNLMLLRIGIIALHASAFEFNGKGILATGWSKGGKTETLLAFMARGATFIGDEWIYIKADSGCAYGNVRRFGVWGWCLDDLPGIAARVAPRDLRRLHALTRASKALASALPPGSGKKSISAKAMRRILLLLEQRLKVNLEPMQIFGPDYCAPSAMIEKIFLVVSHDSPDLTVQPLDSRQIVRRMVFSLQYERMDFLAAYIKFRFAFPELRNDFIEQSEEIERNLLTRALINREAYELRHPYPVSIPALFDAAAPLCG